MQFFFENLAKLYIVRPLEGWRPLLWGIQDPFLPTQFPFAFDKYRSGMVNSNTVNSKFHLIQSLLEILATILSFHV